MIHILLMCLMLSVFVSFRESQKHTIQVDYKLCFEIKVCPFHDVCNFLSISTLTLAGWSK